MHDTVEFSGEIKCHQAERLEVLIALLATGPVAANIHGSCLIVH